MATALQGGRMPTNNKHQSIGRGGFPELRTLLKPEQIHTHTTQRRGVDSDFEFQRRFVSLRGASEKKARPQPQSCYLSDSHSFSTTCTPRLVNTTSHTFELVCTSEWEPTLVASGVVGVDPTSNISTPNTQDVVV
jgi:hypothetical protein